MHPPQEVQGLQLVHQLLQKVNTNVTIVYTHWPFSPTTTNSCTYILDVEDVYLPFIPMESITDTESIQLPTSYWGAVSGAINIPFPFGDSIQTTVFVRS